MVVEEGFDIGFVVAALAIAGVVVLKAVLGEVFAAAPARSHGFGGEAELMIGLACSRD